MEKKKKITFLPHFSIFLAILSQKLEILPQMLSMYFAATMQEGVTSQRRGVISVVGRLTSQGGDKSESGVISVGGGWHISQGRGKKTSWLLAWAVRGGWQINLRGGGINQRSRHSWNTVCSNATSCLFQRQRSNMLASRNGKQRRMVRFRSHSNQHFGANLFFLFPPTFFFFFFFFAQSNKIWQK